MKVYYDESPAGAGKTEKAILSITRLSCKAIFATERKEAFPELEGRIRNAAQKMGTHPVVHHIHGDIQNRGSSVVKAVQDLPERFSAVEHVIVIITHAALLRSNFADFSGWRMVIDEVPAFLDFEEKSTHLDASYFQRHYNLDHVGGAWSAVTLTDAGRSLTTADVRADESHDHLATFHARVLEASRPDAARYVLTNLNDWQAMSDRKVRWCWASAFSLRELAAFDRVELLGNRFPRDIGSQFTQFFDGHDVEWIALPPAAHARAYAHRDVHIHYFSERTAAKSFFGSEVGQRALRECGRYLATVLPPGASIWSANNVSECGLPSPRELLALPAPDYLTPRQAGTNRYDTISHAAMIYAAKPCSNLRGLLAALNIDAALWTQSVEHETILQFATRTSVRDPNNLSSVYLYVFDFAQAEYLASYFDALPHVATHVSRIPLSVELPPKSRGGRPKKNRTPQEQEEWIIARRKKDAERKRAKRKLKKINAESGRRL